MRCNNMSLSPTSRHGPAEPSLYKGEKILKPHPPEFRFDGPGMEIDERTDRQDRLGQAPKPATRLAGRTVGADLMDIG